MDFWINVKELMKGRGITQAVLANDLNLNLRTVQGWFAKNISPDILLAKQIADYLGCTVDYLINKSNGFNLKDDEANLLALYKDIPEPCKPMLIRQAEELASLKGKL